MAIENDRVVQLVADYYANFSKTSNIVRPHPYADSPPAKYDNISETVPGVTIGELINTVLFKKKNKSLYAHDISNYMFSFLDLNY